MTEPDTTEENLVFDPEKEWARVEEAAKEVVEAHARFVEKSDQLAELTEMLPSAMLATITPGFAGYAVAGDARAIAMRDSSSILNPLRQMRKGLLINMERQWMKETDRVRRAALLARLNLTDEEMSLLGISVNKVESQV